MKYVIFTLQERITGFYPSPKSFWSCTHVNSCQKYTLYINLHILLNILSKTTLNIQESRKSIKLLKRLQHLIKKSKSFVSCYHMKCCLQKYTSYQFTYFFIIAYYPGTTGEFTGPSVGHNYIRKNGTNLPIVALNRSLRDLSIGI